MGPQEIRAAVSSAAQHYVSHPSEAKSEDKPAKAVLESGLRVRVEGPNSWAVITDMPHGLGGGGSAPSPGWLRRAAQAACEGTMIAIRAAQGILRAWGLTLAPFYSINVPDRTDSRPI